MLLDELTREKIKQYLRAVQSPAELKKNKDRGRSTILAKRKVHGDVNPNRKPAKVMGTGPAGPKVQSVSMLETIKNVLAESRNWSKATLGATNLRKKVIDKNSHQNVKGGKRYKFVIREKKKDKEDEGVVVVGKNKESIDFEPTQKSIQGY